MNEIPYLVRRNQHRIGKAGRKSEDRLIKQLGGKGRPASGAMPGAKGDIEIGAFLMEAKSTMRDSMTIKLDWLAKIGREARAEGKTPVLSVSFVDEHGRPRMDGEYVLIPLYKFQEAL